ncbi:MAG: flagellar basal body-associated FliL family protein [Planctomycetia bacterium]|nr:flagellar basal body-associated FliL family protein [Planctomycetia bacterium]
MPGTVAKKPADAASQTPQPGQRKTLRLLPIGAGVVVLIAVQIVVTWVVMPRLAPSHAAPSDADGTLAAHAQGKVEHDADRVDLAEVAVGDFSFSNTSAVPGIIMNVDFKLTALASPSQSSILESQMRWHQERIREAINRIVRSSSYDQLTDPNLGTLKRLIRGEINQLMSGKLVSEIVINDIRILEQ